MPRETLASLRETIADLNTARLTTQTNLDHQRALYREASNQLTRYASVIEEQKTKIAILEEARSDAKELISEMSKGLGERWRKIEALQAEIKELMNRANQDVAERDAKIVDLELLLVRNQDEIIKSCRLRKSNEEKSMPKGKKYSVEPQRMLHRAEDLVSVWNGSEEPIIVTIEHEDGTITSEPSFSVPDDVPVGPSDVPAEVGEAVGRNLRRLMDSARPTPLPARFTCTVAGVTFRPSYPGNLLKMWRYDNSVETPAVDLMREPNNPHDPNAVAVVCVRPLNHETIGYVPANLAVDLAAEMRQGVDWTAKVAKLKPSDDKTRPGIDITLERRA